MYRIVIDKVTASPESSRKDLETIYEQVLKYVDVEDLVIYINKKSNDALCSKALSSLFGSVTKEGEKTNEYTQNKGNEGAA